VTSPPELHDVTIPAADDGAVKPWRKRLTRLDESQPGARCCDGQWLDPGSTWQLPAGALIVGADRTSQTANRIRLWRVGRTGELVVERDSTFKTHDAAFGAGMRTTLRTKLAKYPADPSRPASQVSRGARTNEHRQNCQRCGYPVEPRAGLLTGDAGYWTVTHHAGQCPQPWPNPTDAPCTSCGQTVAAGAGVMMPVYRGEPAPAHPAGTCPPKPEPEAVAAVATLRRNQRPGVCILCAQIVAADAGTLISRGRGYAVQHEGDCPPYPGGYTGPTWRINDATLTGPGQRPGRRWKDGEVVRAEAHLFAPAVPIDAPGRRAVGTIGAVSFIGVVIAEHDATYHRDDDGDSPAVLTGDDGWWHRGVVRVATDAEAAAMLAAEQAEAAEASYRRSITGLLNPRAADAVHLGATAGDLAARLDGVELHQVYPDARPNPFGLTHPDRFYVGAEWPYVMVTVHNGADGDNWSASNYGSAIARLLPLTTERAALLLAMRARSTEAAPEVDEWLRLLTTVTPAEAAEMLAAEREIEAERAGGDAP